MTTATTKQPKTTEDTHKKKSKKNGSKKEKDSSTTSTPEKEPTPYASFTKPVKITQQFTCGEVTLREFEGASEVNNSVIIVGFPTENLVSQLTAKYIVKELQLPLIGDLVSEELPPMGVVTQGIASNPFRIYGDKRIVVFTSEAESEEPKIVHQFLQCIFGFAMRHSNTMIICPDSLTEDPTKEETVPKVDLGLGGAEDGEESLLSEEDLEGLETDEDTDGGSVGKQEILHLLEKAKKEEEEYKGMIWYATNSEDLSNKLAKLEHRPVRNLVVGGMIGGFVSSMSTSADIPIACLFAPQNKMVAIGTKACVSIIQCIDHLLGQGVNIISVDNLNKTTQEIEKTLIDVVNKMVDAGAPSKEKHHSMYM